MHKMSQTADDSIFTLAADALVDVVFLYAEGWGARGELLGRSGCCQIGMPNVISGRLEHIMRRI